MPHVDDFWDLFEFDEDYPKEVAERGVPENTLYCYISSTFLGGFINYVEPIKAVMIKRYRESDYDHAKEAENISSAVNTNIALLQDDVLVAAQTENDYWFFWFDNDVSDCVIGRFSKSKCSESEYIEKFDKVAKEHKWFDGESWDISLTGWITA